MRTTLRVILILKRVSLRVRLHYFLAQMMPHTNLEKFRLSSTNQFDQSNHLLPLNSMVNPSELTLYRKRWTVHCWQFNPLSKKLQLAESLLTIVKRIENQLLSLFHSFQLYRVKEKSQAKAGLGLEYRSKHSAFQKRCNSTDLWKTLE